tara:strand:- start:6262 stop:7326 length:1065 start_codon:yes stop_codon:yes gene_type:complete
MTSPPSILVVQTAFLGDLLLCIPLLKNLRRYYPEAKLGIVCRHGMRKLIENLNLVDEIYTVQKSAADSYQEALIDINKAPYHTVFCVHESLRSHFFVSKIKANHKLSYKKWWNFLFFQQRIERPMYLPEPMRALSLLAAYNQDFQIEYQKEMNAILEEENFLSSGKYHHHISENFNMRVPVPPLRPFKKEYMVIAPGSVWATKRWTVQGFADAAKYFLDQGMEVVLLGAKEEIAICNAVATLCPEVKNICGKTDLWEALRWIAGAKLLLSNDSGPMHMAAISSTLNICVFGPTTLNLGYRPWQNQAFIVQKDLSCRPCGKHGHQRCPIGTHECMESISAKEVVAVWENDLYANI